MTLNLEQLDSFFLNKINSSKSIIYLIFIEFLESLGLNLFDSIDLPSRNVLCLVNLSVLFAYMEDL